MIGAAVLCLAALVFVQNVEGSRGRGYDTIRVHPGQTLWAIAVARYPSADPRLEVDAIIAANHLSTPIVYPGQMLTVPASG